MENTLTDAQLDKLEMAVISAHVLGAATIAVSPDELTALLRCAGREVAAEDDDEG